jgi:hypothetical protein
MYPQCIIIIITIAACTYHILGILEGLYPMYMCKVVNELFVCTYYE